MAVTLPLRDFEFNIIGILEFSKGEFSEFLTKNLK